MGGPSKFVKRAPRVDVSLPAVLIDSRGFETDVLIIEISSGGFRLKHSDNAQIGEFVTLRVERSEEFPAQIRWVLGSEAGGVFLTPVDYSNLG